jgi:hypothetical protein
MNKLIKILILASCLSFEPMVNAEMIFNAKTGQTINATISEKQLTRIQVSDLRIVKVFTTADIIIQKDKATGQIYVVPNEGQKGEFNLFIVDEAGDSFNLALTASKNTLGNSIVIIPDLAAIKRNKASQNSGYASKFNSNSYTRNIQALIQYMYLNTPEEATNGYEVMNIGQKANLYKNVEINFIKKYSNNILIGIIVNVTNNTNGVITLDESTFAKQSVLAVSIEQPELKIGETSRVFIVKEAGKGDM